MPAANKAAEEEVIKKLVVKWEEATNTGDLETVLALYAPDATLLFPDEPATHGSAATRASWTELLKTPGLNVHFMPKTIKLSEAGDMAIDYGSVLMKQDGPKGGKVEQTVKYLVVWQKQKGEWKVLYDAYNSNAPEK